MIGQSKFLVQPNYFVCGLVKFGRFGQVGEKVASADVVEIQVAMNV
jgi:hypothetical protein